MGGAGKHGGDPGGFAHWVQVPSLQETLCVLDAAEDNGERQTERKINH